MDFKSIVGHEDIIKHFKRSIELGKVSHAYIINGEVDSGKKMLASAFAKTLQCEAGGTEPCDNCKSCTQASAGSHPDIYRKHIKLKQNRKSDIHSWFIFRNIHACTERRISRQASQTPQQNG